MDTFPKGFDGILLLLFICGLICYFFSGKYKEGFEGIGDFFGFLVSVIVAIPLIMLVLGLIYYVGRFIITILFGVAYTGFFVLIGSFICFIFIFPICYLFYKNDNEK